jgi:hypothetical protein
MHKDKLYSGEFLDTAKIAEVEPGILDVIYGGEPMPENPLEEWMSSYELEITAKEDLEQAEERFIQDCADVDYASENG